MQHKEVLKEWASGVGNLRAWPMEDNRSDGAKEPDEKLEDPVHQAKSFVLASEYDGIRRGLLATKETRSGDPEGHLEAFIKSCSGRMQRIHEAWWGDDGLAVSYLLYQPR